MNYRDIYSQYPELATRLIRLSKQLNDIATPGNDNLSLSTKEMTSIVDIRTYRRKAIFSLFKPGKGEGRGVFLYVLVWMRMPGFLNGDEDQYYTWHYDAGASLTKEQGDYHILTMEAFYINNLLIHDKQYVLDHIREFPDLLDEEQLDLYSIFLLYNNRTSCIQPRYANIKTKLLFHSMLERLKSYDALIMLNLYLMINCIVLDLYISINFLTAQRKFSALGDQYDYDAYLEDTSDREGMIIKIRNTIDQF